MLQTPPGTMNQTTFAHTLYQNFIDVIDTCLKYEMHKRGIDFFNPESLMRNLNKKVPSGSRDMLVGTFFWGNDEILSIERRDGTSKYSWRYVIKSIPIGGKEPPKEEPPTIIYST